MMVKILILLECDHCEEAWPTVVSLRNQLGISGMQKFKMLSTKPNRLAGVSIAAITLATAVCWRPWPSRIQVE